MFSLIFKQKGKVPSLPIPVFSLEKNQLSVQYFLLDFLVFLDIRTQFCTLFFLNKGRNIILFILFLGISYCLYCFSNSLSPLKCLGNLHVSMVRSDLTCSFNCPAVFCGTVITVCLPAETQEGPNFCYCQQCSQQ